MRRPTLLLLATVAAMILTTGVALAATVLGDNKNNVLSGTELSDTLDGKGGADALYGRKGDDFLYGGPGNDNFKNIAGSRGGEAVKAGLRAGGGNDQVYGREGDDDLIGDSGDDILEDSSSSGDWDRAFGGSGNDKIYVEDKDTRDEISCGEDATNTTDTPGDNDVVHIDVIKRKDGTIEYADTVHDKDSNGNSVYCENIHATDRDTGIKAIVRENGEDNEQLPPLESGAKVASVDPS